MNKQGSAVALWSLVRTVTYSVLLGWFSVGVVPHARAVPTTYNYTGQPFDLSRPDCSRPFIVCVSGQITGTVTVDIPAGFTGDVSIGAGLLDFSFTAPTGVTMNAPIPPEDLHSYDARMSFINGSIDNNWLFAIVYPDSSELRTDGVNGDFSLTNIHVNPILFGINRASGTWTQVAEPPPCSLLAQDATVCLPTPQIKFQGAAVTTPQTVVVGQPIQLTTSPPPQTGQTQLWTVSGTRIRQYTPTLALYGTGTVNQLTDFSQTTISFYWITPGPQSPSTETVTYIYTLSDGTQSAPAQATFTVEGPVDPWVSTSTETVNIPPSIPFADAAALDAGGMPIRPGITFAPSADLPVTPVHYLGNYFWSQLILNNSAAWARPDGTIKTCTTTPNGIPGLDAGPVWQNDHAPYPFSSVPDSPPGMGTYAFDSPQRGLDSFVGFSWTWRAQMYLMWQAVGVDDAIPVPLGYTAWGFDATAGRANAAATWQLTPPMPPINADEFQVSTSYPQWQRLAQQPPCGHIP